MGGEIKKVEGWGWGVLRGGRWVIFIGERKAEQAGPLTGAARNNNVVLSAPGADI